MSSVHDKTFELLRQAKQLAKEYRNLTGKPLGVTGEIAEFEAARLLGVELTPARQEGFDAIDTADNARRQLQIKGRCLLPGCKPGQRIGGIKIDKSFDAVLLVLLNEDLEATEIIEADRQTVIDAIMKPGSKARNERGALSVREFKKIGRKRWPSAV